MTPEQPSVRLDELLAQAGWVRGLAGSLVRDPGAADDLAQQTLVAAWKRPPSADRPVRPWLAGVVRNLARQWWRGEGRRQRREASAAEDERPLPGPDELASRLEIQQRLAALVAELDEPLRGTVILRYYEDLSSAEIARRQGVPAGTVRWRLKKAMDLLRERLDREHDGDRAAWVALVAPLAEGLGAPPLTGTTPSPATGATAAGVTGGLVAMATTTKLAVGGAVVVLAAVGLYTVGGPGDADAGTNETARVADIAPADLRDRPAEIEVADAEEMPDTGTDPVDAPAERESALEPVRLRARFVDAEGRTIAGAWLRSRDAAFVLDIKSDANGVATAEIEVPERAFTLKLGAGGHGLATALLAETTEAGALLDLGDVTLHPGGTVSGRVVDKDGNAVKGAWIGVSHEDFAAVDAHNGRLRGFFNLVGGAHTWSDAVGVYRLEGVPTGLQRLWGGKDGWRAAPAESVEVRAGEETVDIVVTIEREKPTDFVSVRVVDPSGEPVPHADLRFKVKGENYTTSTSNVTDAEGQFRVPLHMPGTVSVSASHPDDTWGPAGEEDIRPDGTEVILRLVEPRYMTMNVRGPGGEPVMDVMHNIVVDAISAYSSGFAVDEPGGGPIEVRIPAHRFRIRVEAPGHEKKEVGPWDPDSAPAEVDVVLQRIAGVTGIVIADGEPVPAAKIQLQSAVPAGTRVVHNNFATLWTPDHASALSRSDGVFNFDLRKDGRYVVRVTKEGYAPWVSDGMDLSSRLGAQDLEVRLTEGGSIEGRVIGAPGQSVAGIIVGLNRGDGYARTERVAADGKYRFDLLTPGNWEVTRAVSLIGTGSSTTTGPGENNIKWNCRVEEGTVTNFDLDLVETEGATLEGELRIEAGSARGWKVALQATGTLFQQPLTELKTLATDGKFRLAPGGSGSYRIVMQSPNGQLMIWDTVDLAAAGSRWSRSLRVGSIEGSGAGANEVFAYVSEGSADRIALAQIRADGEGNFRLPHALEGRARLCRVSRELFQSQPDPLQWPVLLTVEVKAGKAATVKLP